MKIPKFKNKRIVLGFGRFLAYALWPIALVIYATLDTINGIYRYNYIADEPSASIWIPLVTGILALAMGWRLDKELGMIKLGAELELDTIANAGQSLGWHLIVQNENSLAFQPKKRSHLHWSRERILVNSDNGVVYFKSLRNPSFTCGIFSSAIRNRERENSLVDEIKRLKVKG